MRTKSLKTAARDRRYAHDRRAFLEAHPLCEIAWDADCTWHASEVHHRKGRGPFMFDQSTWIAGCHRCHMSAHANPAAAYERGVMLHRNQTGDVV